MREQRVLLSFDEAALLSREARVFALAHLVQRLAQVAGYSRVTLYKHWPTRADILRDAFGGLREAHHHTPTGDVRTDLIGELTTFRTVIEQRRIDRALAALAELAASHPELADVRDEVVSAGERVLPGASGDSR